MYDLLYGIIDHVFNTSQGYNSTEQQLYISAGLILVIVLTVVVIDFVYRIIRSIFKS